MCFKLQVQPAFSFMNILLLGLRRVFEKKTAARPHLCATAVGRWVLAVTENSVELCCAAGLVFVVWQLFVAPRPAFFRPPENLKIIENKQQKTSGF